jgi:predicted nucleic acid-binding protein
LIAVVDASVAVKWVVPEPLSDRADRLLDGAHDLIAPDLLPIEAASALWKKVIRDELTLAQAREALLLLLDSGVGWHSSAPLLPVALDLAAALRHPVYDCLYAALAQRERAVLVTADASLRSALRRRRKIEVLPLESL